MSCGVSTFLSEIGEVATEVAVSAAAAVIQTEQATIGADFNAAKRYADLPIPGNAFSGTYAVLAVLPDVQRGPGDWGNPRFAGQGGAQVHQGQDGIKEETLNSQTVNMEAVAELKAVYVNNTAEYARVGYFDTITKSGTNDFHGEGSYYHRNSALGARGFFEEEKTKVIYHTFNVSAAGPIIKNKTFIYALWNGERVPGRSHYVSNVPTQQMRNGDFSQLLKLDTPIQIVDPLTGNPFPGNLIPQDRLSSVAQRRRTGSFLFPIVVARTPWSAISAGHGRIPTINTMRMCSRSVLTTGSARKTRSMAGFRPTCPNTFSAAIILLRVTRARGTATPGPSPTPTCSRRPC